MKCGGEAREDALQARILAHGLHGRAHDAAVHVGGATDGGVGHLDISCVHLAVVDAKAAVDHEADDAFLRGVPAKVVDEDLPHRYSMDTSGLNRLAEKGISTRFWLIEHKYSQ